MGDHRGAEKFRLSVDAESRLKLAAERFAVVWPASHHR